MPQSRGYGLGEHVARQLHPHEHPAATEADDHRGEPDELEEDPVELGGVGVVGLVEDHHPSPAQAEHEATCQPLHDVLAVDPGERFVVNNLFHSFR